MMVRNSLKYGNLVLERDDFLMIKKYLRGGLGVEDYTHDNVLALLRENLQKATIMNETNMPSEIVRLYSIVSIVSSSGIEACFQLVPPDEVDLERDKVSVLSSLGCTVMGLSKGDTIRFGVPSDVVSLRLTKVQQVDARNGLAISEKELRDILKWDSMEETLDEPEV